jgi:hypothetical protein
MLASMRPLIHAQTETGGSCRAKTRRASGTANSSTRAPAMAAARAIRITADRPAMSTRTHRPTANTASMAAVRVATALTPGVARAIA